MTAPLARATLAACVAIVASTTGCTTHVTIRALPADAPLDERLRAYEQLRPREVVHREGRPRVSAVLGDGTIVDDPLDLAPTLSPDAPTLEHAAHAKQLAEQTLWPNIALLGTSSAMLAAMSGGLVMLAHDDQRGAAVVAVSALAGAATAAPLLLYVLGLSVRSDSAELEAFNAYPADLRARLALPPPALEEQPPAGASTRARSTRAE